MWFGQSYISVSECQGACGVERFHFDITECSGAITSIMCIASNKLVKKYKCAVHLQSDEPKPLIGAIEVLLGNISCAHWHSTLVIPIVQKPR